MTLNTTSAALFFQPSQLSSVPIGWLERASELVRLVDTGPVLFTAFGGDFLYDDCYVLAEQGHEIKLWGEVIKARRDELIAALSRGEIRSLFIDVPRPNSVSRSQWLARSSLSLLPGEMFFGIDSHFFPSCEALLRRAFDLCAEFVVPRYGFAYAMPLEDEPASYAMGARRMTLEDFRARLRNRSAGIVPTRTPDDAWQEELYGRQRHLDGLFRGAYPANILSEAHIEGAKLHSARIGTLKQLRDDTWLWEISPDDLPRAEEYLTERRVLVQQAE